MSCSENVIAFLNSYVELVNWKRMEFFLNKEKYLLVLPPTCTVWPKMDGKDGEWTKRFWFSLVHALQEVSDVVNYSHTISYTFWLPLLLALTFHSLSVFPLVRLVERSSRRDEAVNSASSKVMDKVFRRQVDLKKMILERIQMALAEERDVLHRWRKVIISNTHPRWDRF